VYGCGPWSIESDFSRSRCREEDLLYVSSEPQLHGRRLDRI
jgi:hypothetical protein